jgi:exonuclease III
MKGRVCILVHNNLNFVGTDLKKISNDQEMEACTIRLLHNSYNSCILTIYRAPAGNFTCFIKKLQKMLCSLYTLNMQFIICGDINVNHLVRNSRRKILDTLLASFNFLLGFRTNQQKQLTIFLLILLNLLIM